MTDTILIDNLHTFYKTEGEGENLLLLHGWGGNIDSFAPVFDSLKKHFKVTALDFWGFGKSETPTEPLDTYDYASFTKKLLDKIGITKTKIICHSFGGRVALILASKHPELVTQLVLCDSAGMKPRFSFKKKFKIFKYKIAKMLVKLHILNCEKLKKYGSSDFRQLDDRMKKTFVNVVNQHLEKEAKNTKAETLVVWGQNDMDTPLYMTKTLLRLIPHSGLVVFEAAGHFSYLDNFFAFDKTVKSFFGVI